jgi:aspartyl-tRNA(Asn)/glutamyl-tRNA(Gln) amidotransferase subunit A
VGLLRADLHGIRLGLPRTGFFDQCHPDVLAALQTAIAVLRDLGATITEVDLPWEDLGYASQRAISYSEAYAYHRTSFFARRHDYGDRFIHRIALGAFLEAEELVTAERIRTALTAGFVTALEAVDAIVAPSTGWPAYVIDGPYGSGDQAHLTRSISVTGLPALSVPAGFTGLGHPIGMQLVGRAWEEHLILRVAHAYESATDWHRHEPPLTSGPVEPVQAQGSGAAGSRFNADWVLDYARLHGLAFVQESDAAPLAATVAPVKEALARARQELPTNLEPLPRR